jgi:hypothetical protein
MTFSLNRQTLDRPKQTIHAAELFHAHAATIAQACQEAAADDAVVAVVDWDDMVFAGVWIVARMDVQVQVLKLERSGWALIFPPATTKEAVEERALHLARLAFRRWEALQRWTSRHA